PLGAGDLPADVRAELPVVLDEHRVHRLVPTGAGLLDERDDLGEALVPIADDLFRTRHGEHRRLAGGRLRGAFRRGGLRGHVERTCSGEPAVFTTGSAPDDFVSPDLASRWLCPSHEDSNKPEP